MKYISVLRGINVGGHKKIKIADLKELYENEGFENVITYIQSGNVIFDFEGNRVDEISANIERAIKESYGFDVPVDVRAREDYLTIYEDCPYEESRVEENGAKVLVTLLSGEASSDKTSDLESYAKPPERLAIQGSVIYLYCPDGYGRSKLTNTFIESKLGLVATTRNWKTIRKLVELSR